MRGVADETYNRFKVIVRKLHREQTLLALGQFGIFQFFNFFGVSPKIGNAILFISKQLKERKQKK